MTRTIGRVAALVLAALMMTLGAAQAQNMTWKFRSDHPNVVDVELYSQDRDYVWPGNNQVFSLDDSNVRDMPIRCRDGEKICYGAWVRGQDGTYWGTGPQNKQRCTDCCSVCGEGDPPVRLLQ